MYLQLRHIIEIAAILFFFPIILPIIFVTGLIVYLDSRGRIFFLQFRPGKRGKPFKMIKFRTMVESGNQNFHLTRVDDMRITRSGSFLRKYKLDELPQLFNVLKGEMSIIGPRPEPMELSGELEREIPGYAKRREILPGITGWAQVHQGYTETIEDTALKLMYDIYYIENISLLLDCKIIFMTICLILKGKNIR